MDTNNNIPRFHHRLHLLILRRLLIFSNIMGVSTYIFLRIIFYDLPFVITEELLILGKIIMWSTGIAVGISFLIFAGHGISYLIRYRKQLRLPKIVHVAEPSANHKSPV